MKISWMLFLLTVQTISGIFWAILKTIIKCPICSNVSLHFMGKSFLKAAMHTERFDRSLFLESLHKCDASWAWKDFLKCWIKNIAKSHHSITVKTARNDSAVTQNSHMLAESLTESALIAISAVHIRPFKRRLNIYIKMSLDCAVLLTKQKWLFLSIPES